MKQDDWQQVEAAVSPAGHLTIIEADRTDAEFGQAGSVPPSLLNAFAESTFAGLTCLASAECDGPLPASIDFWRQFAQRYFRALCRQPTKSGASWDVPHCPDDATLGEILEAAPPMRGLEYATHDMLRLLWDGLDRFTRDQVAAHKGGLAAYLSRLHREWNLIGRITFHLAENKKNEQQPFAFLATYTESESKSGAVQHIALADALKQSLALRDTQQLNILLEPVSRAAEKCPLVKELLESRKLFAPQAWGIKQAFEFLTSVPVMEQAGVIVRVPNWWNASKPPRPQVRVAIGSKPQSALGGVENLDLQVDVAIDGQPLSAEEVAELMAAREGMALLRGKWVQIDQEQLQTALQQWTRLQKQHVNGVGFLEGMRLLSRASFSGQEIDEELRSWTRIESGSWLRDMLETLRDPSGKVQLDPQRNLLATLRPYQADGVRWLWFATRIGLGVCLADDMGLGKTIQVISLLLQLKFPQPDHRSGNPPHLQNVALPPAASAGGAGVAGKPSLLIVPTSLLGNWRREVERFGPDLRMLVAHRSMCDAEQLQRIADDPVSELAHYDLVATTYGLARREKWLARMDWRLVILDEAQAIKNAGAAQTRAIKAIAGQNRIILSGTPVENHLGDLWSLFDFCAPGLLGSASEFKKFVKANDERARAGRMAAVRKLIRPYVLRRLKTDPKIAPDLPAKTEMRVDCGLTATQAALYRRVIDQLEQALDVAAGIQRRGLVLAALMQLKQICNHPSLFLKRAEFAEDESGKYAELHSICQTLIEKQEKLLLFTQFQSMCQPLASFLGRVFGREGLVLTGKTAAAARNKLVAEFQTESGPPFIVVSVKAGGTGLNLTQASQVVHFDRWWNPAVEDQATDRAFRIGQKRNVIVHKFVCRGTLEEKIDDLLHSKKVLSRELFAGDDEIQLTEMSNEQLMNFIALDVQKASAV